MSEYIQTAAVPANGSLEIPLPTDGVLRGVYSPSGTIDIKWNFNGETGIILSSVSLWEPNNGFKPSATSSIILVNGNASEVEVVLRLEQ